MGIEISNLTFLEAIANAMKLGGGVVHLEMQKPSEGYVVHPSGRISLNGQSYYETYTSMASKNWRITLEQ